MLHKIIDRDLALQDIFFKYYNQPNQPFNMVYIRLFLCLFFIWKLLSRDFTIFGTIPEEAFYFYPIQIYKDYMMFVGLPGVMEVLTFHWVHWITGFPSEAVLKTIQFGVMGLLAVYALVGSGPKRVLPIVIMCILCYLWGFMYMMGQEIDAVALYFGCLFCLIAGRHQDLPLFKVRAHHINEKTLEAGRSFSACLLVFAIYYVISGINKLSDISLVDWFSYSLVEQIESFVIKGQLGFMAQPPAIFENLIGQSWINPIVVPLVYLSHLLAPLAFFKRAYIYELTAFYFLFHYMVHGVAIAFTGYLIVWLMLWNVSAIIQRLFFRKAQAGAA